MNAIDFNPFNEFLLVTCSGQVVDLWDTRKLTVPLHQFHGHTDEVFKVEWAPFNETVRLLRVCCGSIHRHPVHRDSRVVSVRLSRSWLRAVRIAA